MKKRDSSSHKKGAGSRKTPRTRQTGSGSRERSAGINPPADRSSLSQCEARFQAIFQNSRDAIGVSKAGIHVLVNPAYLELFGFPPGADLAGKPILDLIALDRRDQIEEYVHRRIRGETVPSTYETRGLRANGSTFDMEVNVSLYQENGENHTLVILRDITERKSAQKKLFLLKYSVDTTSDAAFWTDEEGWFRYVNASACRSLGYDEKELLGMRIHEVNPTSTPATWSAAWKRFRENTTIRLETIHRRKDGSIFPVEISSSFVVIEGQELICGFARDITERKQAEESLRKSDQLFSLFMRHAPIYTYIKEVSSTESRVLYASENFQHMIGIPGSEMAGKTMQELYPAEFALKITADDWAVVSSGRVLRLDEDFNGRNYTTIKSPLAQGDKTLLIGYTLDITERKRAEQELSASEHRMRSIIESLPIGMHMYRLEQDDRLVFIGANPAAAKILGVDNSMFIGKTIEEAFPLLKDTEVPQRYRDAAASGITWKTESITYNDGAIQGAFEVHAFQTAPHTMVAAFEDITQRKQYERALTQSEEKYRRLYNETPVLLHSIDRNAILVDVNDYWLTTLGYTRDDVIGRNVTDFYSNASKKYAREVVQPTFFRDGFVKDIAYQFVKKNGEVLDVLLSATAERDAAGAVIRSQAVSVDVTERKRLAEELRMSEEKYRSLFENSEIAMFLTKLDGSEVLDGNQRFLDLIGKTREETIGKPSHILWEDPKERDKMVGILMEKGSVTEFEFNMLNAGKGVRNCSTSLRLYRERGLLEGSITDITERKQAELALRENQARLDLALQSAHMGVWRWEIKENRSYFDDLTCQLLGIDATTFTGTLEELLKAVHPADREKVEAARSHAIEKGVPYEPTYRIVWQDGSIRYVTARARLDRDDAGRPARLLGVLWDTTDQHLFEQELLKSQKLESIGTLAGGIAHDFNNLLQGIFGYISMARMTIDQKEKSLAMLTQAEKALHQSVNLTTQLLTFSKGGKPVTKTLDLRPVIENALAFSLSGSRVTPEIVVDEDLYAVNADEGQIGQVIQNIVLNADQAMPLGGTIRVAARNVRALAVLPSVDLQGDLVEISIHDQGAGIPEEHLSRIFDPYFTTKEKGSGLGLATSYSIIKNHGGLIRVQSEFGKGTAFFIYLPASRASIEKPGDTVAPAAMRKCRILVMDDEEIIRTLAGELLRALGHEVAFAEKGETAVEVYRNARDAGLPFDIVILDLTIRGGMGGMETLRKLIEIDPQVRAIVSSGYSEDASLPTSREKEFRAFLKKPYDINSLQSILHDVLA